MDSLPKLIKEIRLNHNDTQIHVGEHTTTTPDSSINWKRIGNEHFAFKRYKDAIAAYTKGIEEGDKSIDMLANRSCAYLRHLKYKSALDDAQAALVMDKKHIKCIYRKVKALFGLAMYKEAIDFLNKIQLGSLPQNDAKVVTDLMEEGKCYLAQSENGDYPWNDIYKTKSVYYDMADYTSGVIVKEVPMKGRGLFATKTFKAGELVLASKAFAYVEDKNPCNITYSLKFVKGSVPEIHVQLLGKICEVLNEFPEKSQAVGSLYAGPELGALECKEDTSNIDYMDMKRIEFISLYNAISTNQRIDGSHCRNAGLWIIPSFINHSCVDANSSWIVFGDFLFVRAFKDIAEGDEIEIAYKAPTGLVAQERLNMYNFTCQCRLCKRDLLDNMTIKADRASLLAQLQSVLSKFDDPRYDFKKQNDIEINRILKLFEQTRKDAPELNLCLVDVLIDFGKLRLGSRMFMKSVDTFEKLYHLSKNVAAFTIVTTVACIHIILSYAYANKINMAKSWVEILKKETILFDGSLNILYLQFVDFIKKMREYDLDI